MNSHHSIDASSIDLLERKKFDQLSSVWWDKKGPMWPLHKLNALRVEYILQILCDLNGFDSQSPFPLTGLRVLDVGCGGGILSESLARLGAHVHGIDISTRNIDVARLHSGGTGMPLTYDVTTAEELAASASRYDVVLNMEVVEHVANLPAFMRACNALLDPAGVQFVATINRNPLSWLVAVFGAEVVLRWLPRGTHQWSKLVKPSELKSLLEKDALEMVDSVGVLVNPFTRNMSLSRLTAVNYMLVAEKPA